MNEYHLGEIERRFAELIWTHEPVNSGELVKLALETLGWKKSTTYTVLRRLCDRGIFRSEGGVVTSLLSREEFDARQSEAFVNDAFDGSLPRFLTAFAARGRLSDEEIDQLQAFIDSHRGKKS